MTLNPLTLVFTHSCKDLEKPFIEQYALSSLKQLRFALWLGIFLYATFGLLDHIVVPDLKYRFWLVRFAVVCPSVLAVIILSYASFFKRIMQAAIGLLILIGSGGIIYMAMSGPPAIAGTYYVGLMLVLMLGYSVVRARFIWATLAGCTVTLAYLVVTVGSDHLSQHIIVNNNYFLIAANMLGMMASYNLEFYARRDYYMSHLLTLERQRAEVANQQLEQTVQKRTAMLARTNEDLRHEIEAHQQLDREKKQLEDQLRQAQKMEAIGTLAGGIAHDFNNILAALMGHTELALMQLNQNKDARKSLSEVLNASDRAKDLVSQILSFSRHSDSELKPLQISTVVKDALRLIRASLPSTIVIKKRIEDPQGIVVGNATQIHQILMNLCTNAAHAMGATGGSLTIALHKHDVQVDNLNKTHQYPSNLGPGPYVKLTVADTGQGIPAHLLDRIFDPYFTTKEKDVGTGLGLAVVHGIIQNHHGFIQVTSSPGNGASFDIYLPRVESSIKPEIRTLQSIPNGHERILFIDDDPALAELGGKLLTTLGYQVVIHTDANQALEAFRDAPRSFDLIVTDLIMPGLTGEALARKALTHRPKIPIIVCTGFNDVVRVEALEKVGIKGILHKPIKIFHLAHVIRQALDGQTMDGLIGKTPPALKDAP